MKKFDKYTQELEAAKDDFDQRISELGLQIREEIILPICRRHKLGFVAGMGMFFFYKKRNGLEDITMSDELECHQHGYKTLIPIIKLLNEEVSDNQVLGYYVDDVRRE